MKILTYPHPLLRKKTQEIQVIDQKIQNLALKMQKIMIKNKGIGLAANQIGKLLKIVVLLGDKGPIILINPEITKKSLRKEMAEEGCLSLPEIFCLVKRSKKIQLKALNLKGEELILTLGGLLARAAQHEVDHLNGILIIDKAINTKYG